MPPLAPSSHHQGIASRLLSSKLGHRATRSFPAQHPRNPATSSTSTPLPLFSTTLQSSLHVTRAHSQQGAMERATPVPVYKDLVLLGGGHSHLFVLQMFGMQPEPGVRITLISRDIHTPYSGMLPGYVAGHYSYDDCHIDLAMLSQWAGVRFVHAEAQGLDTKAQLVLLKDRPPIRYDVLSINLGITPDLRAIPGALQHATPVKPIFSFVERIDALLRRARDSTSPPRIAVIGGGAGGVELAMALAHRLAQERAAADAAISLITRGPILPTYPSYARTAVLPLAKAAGVDVLEGDGVARVEAGAVVLEGGGRVAADEVLLCTQAAAAGWLKATGLPLDEHGFVAIDETLRVAGGPANVFACGDCATSVTHPRPKAGVFAVRQGPPLASNLRAALTNAPLKPFIPQTSFLSLISTGPKHAVGTKGSWLGIQGGWVWTLKDWIDRAFMDRFGAKLSTVRMAGPPTQSLDAQARALRLKASMRCGGCGSKVGGPLLAKVLRSLPGHAEGSGVVVGVGDDAAVIEAPPVGEVLVQTVDFMRSVVGDPYVMGAVVANHCLADCYAMGATPRSALAVVGVPFAGAAQVESDVRAMLLGALSVLRPAGCPLVGGHTSELDEPCLGFSITGSGTPSSLMRVDALRPDDVLVLTKPLGTGVLLAAAAARKTKGRHVAAALDSMLAHNAAAARVLRECGVRAATDVSGFGLLGHAAAMANASGVGVVVDAAAVPLLPGVQEAIEAGVRSSLHDDNVALAVGAGVEEAALLKGKGAALVDPQTSGGFLVGVAAGEASRLVVMLREAGYEHATVVGRVVHGDGVRCSPRGEEVTLMGVTQTSRVFST